MLTFDFKKKTNSCLLWFNIQAFLFLFTLDAGGICLNEMLLWVKAACVINPWAAHDESHLSTTALF